MAKEKLKKSKALKSPVKVAKSANSNTKNTDKSKDKKTAKVMAKVAKSETKKAAKVKVNAKAAKPVDIKTVKAAKPEVKLKSGPVTKAKINETKKSKKAKKKESELEEDMLVSDDDLGAEEIPDLAEFDETEEEIVEVEEELTLEVTETKELPNNNEEVILLDAEGRRYCRVRDCDQPAIVEAYCRYHYLLLWKKIQIRRKILQDGKLVRYVDELTSRYPDKFLEMIKRDLRTEKDFLGAIAELEIDESAIDNEFEDEAQSFIEEVRGISEGGSISDEEEF